MEVRKGRTIEMNTGLESNGDTTEKKGRDF
jgi:hypothetical protein